jgi:hypothetical protein
MTTAFFGADGIALFGIVPTGTKITSDSFCHNIVEMLEKVFDPDGRVLGTILHFHRAPVHRADKVRQKLDDYQFR